MIDILNMSHDRCTMHIKKDNTCMISVGMATMKYSDYY